MSNFRHVGFRFNQISSKFSLLKTPLWANHKKLRRCTQKLSLDVFKNYLMLVFWNPNTSVLYKMLLSPFFYAQVCPSD